MQQELQNWTGGPQNQCKLIGIKSRFALIGRKAQEQKKTENFRNFENFKEKKMSKFTFVLNLWPQNSWLGTLDHLVLSLGNDRYKKIGKISENVLLIFGLAYLPLPLCQKDKAQWQKCQFMNFYTEGDAHFGTWEKTLLHEICVSGTVVSPILTRKSPTCTYVHTPNTMVVETVIFV